MEDTKTLIGKKLGETIEGEGFRRLALKRGAPKSWGLPYYYLRVIGSDIALGAVFVILTSSLAYVLWIGKPDIYYLYLYKLQGGFMVWTSKWIVFVCMAASSLALFFTGLFFLASSVLNLLVVLTNRDILRLQAIACMEKDIRAIERGL